MPTLSDLGIKDNPFRNLPEADVSHWAGMPDIKRLLSDVVSSVRPDDVGASEFVILHGIWGAGKTHALRYFAHEINEGDDGRAVYLSEIMARGGLSFSSLCPRIHSILEESLKTRFIEHVRRSVDDCVEKMESDNPNYSVTPETAIKSNVSLPEDQLMVQSLYDEEQIPQFVSNDDYEAIKGLASLLRVITLPIGNNPPAYGSVYIFLDEVETALDEKATKQIPFFQAIRTLINAVPEHFALVLSFSVHAAVLEAAVPEPLQQRMTRPYIECEKLQADAAKKFVAEYLSFVRKDDFTPPQPFYPFSEGAINVILDRDTILVPRKIIDYLRRVFRRSIQSGRFDPQEGISEEMASDILNGIA